MTFCILKNEFFKNKGENRKNSGMILEAIVVFGLKRETEQLECVVWAK